MRRDCRFQTLFPMASLKIILCYLLIKRYHQEKMRGQSLLILKLCGFRYNAVKFSSCQIISLITFNPLLTADMESSQATTVHFLCCFSIAKSCPTLCSPMDCSTSGFSPSLSPRVCSNSCPLGWWCHPIILSSCYPLLLLPSIFPSIRVFSSNMDLCIRCPSIRASASAPTHAMNF